VLLLLFGAGLAAGFIDAIAGGGGLITVPALLWAGLPVPMALGTNKMQASCGTLLAVTRFARAGLIVWSEVRLAVLVTFVFAALGAWAVTMLSKELLKMIVPWLLLSVAVYALLSPRLGLQRSVAKLSAGAFALLGGSLLGFYDGFFGPGVGSFWTIALLALRGLELTRATAYTKVVNLTSNVASLLVFLWAGTVDFKVALVMIGGQLIGAQLGSGLVLKHGAPFVRVVFLIVVFALTAKLLWDQF
jgi:uncharacterized membrane protein YfcA